ncbi:MAG: phosphatase PAP2 family protein [Succinivibrio sp.]|nr:phosphatase PAP2 family protein [Succinivibrio sp.]
MHNVSCKLVFAIATSLLISACVVHNDDNAAGAVLASDKGTDKYASKYDADFGFLSGYLSRDSELPEVTYILPKPPESEDPAYFYDFVQYESGKTVRANDKERFQLAKDDENWGIGQLSRFSEVYGMELSLENTPELWALIQHSATDINNTVEKTKHEFFRPRPFVHFGEPSGKIEQEKYYIKTSSFPSGHTAFGWGIALILSEINPACQEAIMSRGYDFGQSRVILGHHYQSDVDAGRIVASMVVARLHSAAEFQLQMKKAKAEFAALKSKQTKYKKSRAGR